MSVAVKYVRPSDDALRYIAENMREGDAAELRAAGCDDFLETLHSGVEKATHSAVAKIEGEPVCVFGVAEHNRLTRTGIPWMLSAGRIEQYKRAILEQSPSVVAEMRGVYPRLFNYVHAENRISVRWLKWLGFELDAPVKMQTGAMFHRFHMGMS